VLGAVGAALVVLAWTRGRRWWTVAAAVVRSLRLGFDPATLKRLIGTLADLDSVLHSLKNVVFVVPGMGPDDAPLDDLRATLARRNVAAIESHSRTALDLIAKLAADDRAHRQVATACAGPQGDRIVQALDALADARDAIGRHVAQVREHGRALEGAEEGAPHVTEPAAASLQAFHELIAGPAGLRELLQRALDECSLAAPLRRSVASVEARAASLGIDLAIPPEATRIRIAGRLAPLTDAIAGVLTNALDAVEEMARAAGPTFRGTVTLYVEDGDPVRLHVIDNGCGMLKEILEALRRGQAASTKGKGHGTGLARARETLERCCEDADVTPTSEGPHQGADVIVSLPRA
jgi:signal transduction histidine kinase